MSVLSSVSILSVKVLFYKMYIINGCFLNVIILCFTLQAIHVLSTDTEKFQKRLAFASKLNIEDCKDSSEFIIPSCLPELCKCKGKEECDRLFEKCIKPLFSANKGSNKKMCVIGRCECPDELQFCTNGIRVERIKDDENEVLKAEKLEDLRRKSEKIDDVFIEVTIHWDQLLLLFVFCVVHTLYYREAWLKSFMKKFVYPTTLYVISIVLVQEYGMLGPVYCFIFLYAFQTLYAGMVRGFERFVVNPELL